MEAELLKSLYCDRFAQMQRSRLSEGRGVNSSWSVLPWRMKVALSLHLAVDRCPLWVVSCTRFATVQIVPPDAEPSSLPRWSRDALGHTAVEYPEDICVQVSHPQLPQETEEETISTAIPLMWGKGLEGPYLWESTTLSFAFLALRMRLLSSDNHVRSSDLTLPVCTLSLWLMSQPSLCCYYSWKSRTQHIE